MTQKTGPGKAQREGISVIELADMFPTEDTAREWFESMIWSYGRYCPRCGSVETSVASATSGLPYYCPSCKRAFSVRIGTALERSKVPLRKWAYAIYLEMTSLKGISSMKLHREIKVTQKTAWFILHRIKEVWRQERDGLFAGPVEIDETYMGGKERNKHSKNKLRAGRGGVGKSVIVGARDRATNEVRAKVVEATDAETLQGFVADHAAPGATVYTDEARAYKEYHSSTSQCATAPESTSRRWAHTNGMESFWATIKRAHKGVYHKISPKHLDRYVSQFAGKHNSREADTIMQMQNVVARMVGKRLMYRDLIADNGLSAGARQ